MTMADGTGAATTTPLDVINAHANAMKTIATRLLLDNERLRKTEIDLNMRLSDALEEVQTLRRQVETMQAEYQALTVKP